MTLPGETLLPLPVPDGSERKGTPPYPPKGGTEEDTGGVEADRGILLGHVLAGDARRGYAARVRNSRRTSVRPGFRAGCGGRG